MFYILRQQHGSLINNSPNWRIYGVGALDKIKKLVPVLCLIQCQSLENTIYLDKTYIIKYGGIKRNTCDTSSFLLAGEHCMVLSAETFLSGRKFTT